MKEFKNASLELEGRKKYEEYNTILMKSQQDMVLI